MRALKCADDVTVEALLPRLREIGIFVQPSVHYPSPDEPATLDITSLTPNSVVQNANTSITIAGAGFATGATVNLGSAFGLVPTSITPTSLVVPVEAINIAQAGTLAMSVKNPNGEVSNSLDLTVT